MANPWILAARPPTLWAAVAPVLVAAGVAIGDNAFRSDAFTAALAGAVAIQVAANFANDASDAARGADTDDRIGPQRAVASGLLTSREMWTGVVMSFAVAAAAGVYLTVIAGWVVIAIGVASVAAALTYVGGPIPYGYRGLGELFVFVFFGLVATVGSRYVHDQTAPAEIWFLSVPMGLLVTAILVANNVRDIETDAGAGKRTLAVIMGRRPTVALYGTLIYGAFLAVATLAAIGATSRWTALALVALPLGVPLVRTVRSTTAGPALITVLKGTARLQVVVGVLLAVGAAIS
ncbi:MAG: 1,4-dihydroxy-2-naphthoate polyprenyltransferase [Acidimicrobiia bacterium]|nr:1,4-dihydroxy-2-naphthoate polyprenyltransferase [Acidimicrobiia bacterium]